MLREVTLEREVRMRDRQVLNLPMNMVKTNPYQPRKVFSQESIFELAQSIEQFGLIQPITVRKLSGGTYELIAGERRMRAAMSLGMTHIDAIVFFAYEQDSAVMALIENIQRENLHFLEEAEGYQTIIREHGFSQDELARRIGLSQCTIANKMRLLKLPLAIKKDIIQNSLTERHARALLRLPSEEAQKEALAAIIAKGLNVKASEELIDRMLMLFFPAEEGPKQQKKITALMRDTRLYLNSIRTVVDQMEHAGFAPKYEHEEYEGGLRITIMVPYK